MIKIITAMIIIIAAALLTGCDHRKCLKSHPEKFHVSEQIMFVTSGKMQVPIIIPGYDYEAPVCDVYETPEGHIRP